MKKAKRVLIFIFGLVAFSGFTQDKYFTNVGDTNSHTVAELAEKDERFSIFLNFLEASDLDTSMEYTEGYTIFMPTNKAFKEMEIGKLSNLAGRDDQVKLINFMKNYILPTVVKTSEFKDDQVIDMEGDKIIEVSSDRYGEGVRIGGAEIVQGDIEAEDGVIHVIDALITPVPDFMF